MTAVRLAQAGPKNRPRAPNPSPPGDICPEGVAKWLRNERDFALLYEMALYGADLRHTSPPQLGTTRNMVLPQHHAEITRQLRKELDLGWLTVQPPHHAARLTRPAPIFAKEEPGKLRRLTDYSDRDGNGIMRGANAVVNKASLGEAPMDRALDLARVVTSMTSRLERPPVLLVRDISKAYRRIAVRPKDIQHLHTVWEGVHMWDTRLPFGHAAAAHHCCKLTKAIASAFTTLMLGNATALAYVDDFIVVADEQHAAAAEALLSRMLDDIGMPITPEKAAAAGTWACSAEWIGYTHDTARQTHALKPDKIPELRKRILQAKDMGRLPRRQMAILIGKLNHVANVHHPARAHMQALHRAHMRSLASTVDVDLDAQRDLDWWLRALVTMPDEAKMSRSPSDSSWCIATDASLTGIGAALHETRENSRCQAMPVAAIAAPFASRAEPKQMMELEAIAVLAAIHEWGPQLTGEVIWLQLDNQSLVFSLRAGRSKSPRCNDIIGKIFTYMIAYSMQIIPFHVMSEQNEQADALSRQWEPCPAYCKLDHSTPTIAFEERQHLSNLPIQVRTKPPCGIGLDLQAKRDCQPRKHCGRGMPRKLPSWATWLSKTPWEELRCKTRWQDSRERSTTSQETLSAPPSRSPDQLHKLRLH